jgi:exodeoxyribonuclease VII large subunit
MPLPENVQPMSVSVLTNRIKLRLEEHFPDVWVAGEMSNLVRQQQSGHWYFSLKDRDAVVKCMMRVGFNRRIKFEPKNGMELIVHGQVSMYVSQGNCQLYVDELLPKGIGAAELALQQLREKLREKGYFDPKRKRRIARCPRRIALIASPTGAAIRDMLEILTHRWPLADVVVCPSKVQGDGAAQSVAAVIRTIGRLHSSRRLLFSAIVVGRGGGSTEDLAAFNEECVADAIHESCVPVISAVGHETDVSIADLVADYRALTPSQAITHLCPDRQELMEELIERGGRLRDALRDRLGLMRERLVRLADRPALRRPLDRVRVHEQRLDGLAERLHRAVRTQVQRSQRQLDANAERLGSLSPLNVLKRGYSLTRTADGVHLIRDAATVAPGDRIVTRLARGEIVSRVETARTPED